MIYSIATKEDLEELAEFLEQPSIDSTFVKPLSQRNISIKDRVYKKHESGYWIIARNEENNGVVGCLAVIPVKGKEIEISTFAVATETRGQGVGSTLLDEAIKLVKEKYSVDTLILDSWEGNPVISRLMEKKGFNLREAFEDPDKRPPGVRTVVYSRKL